MHSNPIPFVDIAQFRDATLGLGLVQLADGDDVVRAAVGDAGQPGGGGARHGVVRAAGRAGALAVDHLRHAALVVGRRAVGLARPDPASGKQSDAPNASRAA